jgi:hypothetical protein
VLRIPLSIENPDAQAIDQLEFTALAVKGDGTAGGTPLGVGSLRFEPATMTIAAHDFEKLTVFVDTRPETAPGPYEAAIGLGGSRPEINVRFAVVGADH